MVRPTMAKTKTRSAGRMSIVKVPQPIIMRAPPPARATKHKGKHHRPGHRSSEKVLTGILLGGFVLGYLDKPDSKFPIPTIPALGKPGTIAIIAHFMGKGKPGYLTNIRDAAAAVFAYEYGSTGAVKGDEDFGTQHHGGARGHV